MVNIDKDPGRIRAEFEKRKTRRIILFAVTLGFLVIIGFFAIPLMDMFGISRMVWAPFVYLIMFILIIAIAFVWRCPVCNALLGDVFRTNYCSKCGFNFSDKDTNNG